VPVETENCKDVQFKQHAVTEFLSAEKIPPIDIRCHMQAVYGDKCVDVSTCKCWAGSFKQEEVVSDRIQKLDKCWEKCIEIEGDYVEM
jgi:hypothetical protein